MLSPCESQRGNPHGPFVVTPSVVSGSTQTRTQAAGQCPASDKMWLLGRSHYAVSLEESMSRSQGKKKPRRQAAPEAKATHLWRHLVERVPVPDLCIEGRRGGEGDAQADATCFQA